MMLVLMALVFIILLLFVVVGGILSRTGRCYSVIDHTYEHIIIAKHMRRRDMIKKKR